METHAQASSFGICLRRYRTERGLSQEEVAAQAGLSAQAISALERGISQWPYRDTVARLATALGLATDERRSLEAAARRPARRPNRPAEPAAASLPVAGMAARPPEELKLASLPHPLTALLGRSAELERIEHLLTQSVGRLLTVTGPGGIGKTRLAIEAARRLHGAYPDGAVFVELAPLQDGALLSAAIARTLGVRDAPGRSLSDAITAFIGQRVLLLVLDNCEHLIEACAELAPRLLAACARLRVLATSRTALRLRGEQVFPLAPLALPPVSAGTLDAARRQAGQDSPTLSQDMGRDSPTALAESPAVALFVERATAVDPDFMFSATNADDVASICRQLDGLPLALELAAAHCAYLSPRALLARLAPSLPLLTGGARDLPARQQTLRDTIAWSYELLPAGSRRVFRCLAVCADGCTLAAAGAICAPDSAAPTDPLAIVGQLETLVAASLLLPATRGAVEPRFAMLETLREYGLERLAESGEETAARERHLTWYLGLAEQAEPELTGPEASVWLSRLEAEHANLRAALTWSIQKGGSLALGLALAGRLWRFWRVHSHLSEGRLWLETALTCEGATAPEARALALTGAGSLAWRQGDYARAAALHEEALALLRALGNKQGSADALNGLGLMAWEQGDYARATALHEQSLALRRELGDRRGIANALNNLGLVAHELGDYARATGLYEESLTLMRALGDKQGVANALSNLGNIAHNRGDDTRATALHEQSLALRRELGDRRGIAASLNGLGLVACEQSAYARARGMHEQSLALYQELGDTQGVAIALDNLGTVLWWQGEYMRAVALHEQGLALRRELGDRQGIALSLCNLGFALHEQGDNARATALYEESLVLCGEIGSTYYAAVALQGLATVAHSQPERAARLLAAADALRSSIGAPLPPRERASWEHVVAELRAALGEGAFAAAWAAGAALSLEQALAAALTKPAGAEAAMRSSSDHPAALAEERTRRARGSAKRGTHVGRPGLRVLPGGAPSPATPPEADLSDDERAK